MTPQFHSVVQTYGPRMMADLGLTAEQVAGVFGNLAVESAQFTANQEKAPTVKGSRGGWGWAQWTGPRRVAFEQWVKAQGIALTDPEGFYGYLVLELEGSERKALTALKRTTSLDSATTSFMKTFERPGVPHEEMRRSFAREALAVLTGSTATAAIPAGKWAEEALPAFEIVAIQNRLIALGYHVVGLADGKWGDRTTAAVKALQEQAARHDSSIVADGHYGPQTKALLGDEANRAEVSEERATTTASDLAKRGTPAVVAGRSIQWSSIASVLTSIAGVAFLAWQNYQTGTTPLPGSLQFALNFLPPWVGLLAPPLFAIYNAAVAKGLIGSAVERVREGIDNSGLPPQAGPGGLFGSLFGGRG